MSQERFDFKPTAWLPDNLPLSRQPNVSTDRGYENAIPRWPNRLKAPTMAGPA